MRATQPFVDLHAYMLYKVVQQKTREVQLCKVPVTVVKPRATVIADKVGKQTRLKWTRVLLRPQLKCRALLIEKVKTRTKLK